MNQKNGLTELVNPSCGAMLACGDLFLLDEFGTACKYYDKTAELCKKQRKNLYVATDIMKSLETCSFPSCAEIIDIFYSQKVGATHLILPYKVSPGLEVILKVVKEISESYE